MKRILILSVLISLLSLQGYSQMQRWLEDFDSSAVSYTQTPAGSWVHNTTYTLPGSSLTNPKSYWAQVPNTIGTTVILESKVFDFSNQTIVLLRFSQICKISPRDTTYIQYKLDGTTLWQTIDANVYKGTGIYVPAFGFNANSYAEWQGNDSNAIPTQSWWRNELFDLSDDLAGERNVQIRFVLKRGNVAWTQASYGWLLENVEVAAATFEMNPPIVEFIAPFPVDTTYRTNPCRIVARVESTTDALIEVPILTYTTIHNGVTHTNTIVMTPYMAGIYWQATIPQLPMETAVYYSVLGKDTNGNESRAQGSYYIKQPPLGGQSGSITIGTGAVISPSAPANASNSYSWTRQLYLGKEFNSKGGLITHLAWENGFANSYTLQKQICYFRAVSDSILANAAYEDPDTVGATQVWQGQLSANSGWIEITLDKAFHLPPGKNLLVYWHNLSGTPVGGTNGWKTTTMSANLTAHAATLMSNANDPQLASFTLTKERPNARFYMAGIADTNSVAMVSLESPTQNLAVPGTPMPITLTIQNRGLADLTSVNVTWSLNGVIQSPTYAWSYPSGLAWDFTTQFTAGSYTPTVGQVDTILVWLSNPNGKTDIINYDDTLQVIINNGCGSPFNGEFTIAPGEMFETISSLVQALDFCGANGHVTAYLPSGEYNENWIVENFGNRGNLGTNILTITSKAQHKDSVILRPVVGNGIYLRNIRNIGFKHITVDVSHLDTACGILLNGNYQRVSVDSCSVLANTVTSNPKSACILAQTTAGYGMNITVSNNLLNGGYYGCYVEMGVGGTRGSSLRIENNTIVNQYYQSVYAGLAATSAINTISNNTILSRTTNASTQWFPIRIYDFEGNITGNRILQRTATITKPQGIYLGLNSSTLATVVLVANNEIIQYAADTSYGINTSNSQSRLINNSIFTGGTGKAYGIYIGDFQVNHEIKNNNIVMASSDAYPMYFIRPYYLSRWTINYNNYYAPQYIGYTGANRTTLSDWKSVVTADINSVNIAPNFVDNTQHLEWNDYTGLECSVISPVTTDIKGNVRPTVTYMGCHTAVVPEVDILFNRILGFNEGKKAGDTSTLQLEISNGGSTTITGLTIGWNYNGTDSTVVWNGNLPLGATETVTLGFVTYRDKNNTTFAVPATITGQGGLLTDAKSDNDTAKARWYACPSSFDGIVTIGNSGTADFETIDDAFEKVTACGVDGDLVFAFEPGTYSGTIDLSNNGTLFGNHKLTLTSSTGDANDVTLVPLVQTNDVIRLSNSTNVVIDALTIDVTSGLSSGVRFLGACTNIVVSNCRILSSPTTAATSNLISPIVKMSTGTVDSIFIINNVLDGGNTTLYFAGGVSTTYASNVWIDNNIMTNAYKYGAYIRYTNLNSFSNNTILSRDTSSIDWRGLYVIESCPKLINGNIIRERSESIKNNLTVYLDALNQRGSDTTVFSNNEIYGTLEGAASTALSISAAKIMVINNTVYAKSRATGGRALYISNGSNYVAVKNNILISTGTTSYPMYLSSTSNNWDIDANNYYGSQYIAYANATNPHTSLATYRNVVTSDTRSVSVLPAFKDITENFELWDSIGISAPVVPPVTTDIYGRSRGAVTTNMGSYHYYDMLDDVQPVSFLVDNFNTAGSSVKLGINIRNVGATDLSSATINWAINGVDQTPPIEWTGNLAAGAVSDTIEIHPSYIVPAGATKIMVYTSLPNGQVDGRTINDTIWLNLFGCETLHDTYTVGTGGYFDNLNDAINVLENCGQSGDVTFAMLPGTYNMADALTTIAGTDANNRLTITSSTGKANDVTFTSTVNFNNAKHITLKEVTVNVASLGVSGIVFAGTCSDIEINGCVILASTTTTSSAVNGIMYANTANSGNEISNVRIIDNTIQGGRSNIHLAYPGSTNGQGKNNRIDNNTLTEGLFSGIYATRCGHFKSISDNTITTRAAYSQQQYGMYYYLNLCIDTLQNNKILMQGTNQCYGLYLDNLNLTANGATQPAFVANNEIRHLTGISDLRGIWTSTTNADILHNSVYLAGTSSAYGLNINSTTDTGYLNVKNNIFSIATTDAAGYPLYAGDTLSVKQPRTILDYNDYHSTGVSIAFIRNTAVPDLVSLRTRTGQNANSVNVDPMYKNINTGLELADTTGVNCPLLLGVPTDITGLIRDNTTVMGAYGYSRLPLDAALNEIIMPNDLVVGQPSNPGVRITNTGITAITSVKIAYSYNGNVKPSIVKTINIPSQQDVVLSLDTAIIALYGNNNIKVWIEEVNGGLDGNQRNDTLNLLFYGCYHSFETSYIVGSSSSADFPTLQNAFTEMVNCGMKGDVIFYMESGTYTNNFDLSTLVNHIPNEFTLTISSLKEHPDSVTFQASTGSVFKFNNNKNITVRYITVDATQATHGVEFVGDNTNIEFYGCNIKANPTATIGNALNGTNIQAAVYCNNPSRTTAYNLNKIRFINNNISGGYTNFFFYYVYGSASNLTGIVVNDGIVIDSNNLSGGFYSGIYSDYYNVFNSISYNTITSHPTLAGSYSGIHANNYVNVGRIINNKISILTATNYATYGIRFYNNNRAVTTSCLIANNEIRVTGGSGAKDGIYLSGSFANVYHNSLYLTGTGAISGIRKGNPNTAVTNIERNLIYISTSNQNAYPLHYDVAAAHQLAAGRTNYNNYYSTGAPIANIAGTLTAYVAGLQTLTGQDANSLNIAPVFIDATANLELSNYSSFLCPLIGEVPNDFNGAPRLPQTAMGAYAIKLNPNPSVMIELANWRGDVIDKAVVPVEVSIKNTGYPTITNATIQWSVNGNLRAAVSLPGTLESDEMANISLGNYTVTTLEPVYEIKAWLSSVNGGTNALLDTAIAISELKPLAELISPIITDTIYYLSFDVRAKIRSLTGAPVSSPLLYIENKVDGIADVLYDTIEMLSVGSDIWEANVPQQYYGSFIRYKIPVEDSYQNAIILSDSVYIQLGKIWDEKDTIVGTGTRANNRTPISTSYKNSWSRQIYLEKEICPNNNQGVTIKKMAWDYAATEAISIINQKCYFKAVDENAVVSGYVDPLADGAVLVWQGTYSTSSTPSWVEIALDKAFVLPSGKNLMVYWLHEADSIPDGAQMFNHTSTTNNMSIYAQQNEGGLPTSSNGTLTTDRANAKFTIASASDRYSGYNLEMVSVVEPINNVDSICSPDYSPVRVAITNFGTEDYDFSQNIAAIGYEIIDPLQNIYANSLPLTGILESGKTDTLMLMTALFIKYSGHYDIKAWINSPADIVRFDDSLSYTFISGRVGLPIDEFFSDTVLPDQFVTMPTVGDYVWAQISKSDLPIVPNFGSGVIAFESTAGASAILSTRQLDLYQTSNPYLEYWYYHDSTALESDRSYTEVNVLVDGEPNLLRTLSKKDGNKHGWWHYIEPLDQFSIGSHCILIQFGAMNRGSGTVQYIDRIYISSEPDAAVAEILIDESLDVCDRDGKNVRVVINTTKKQLIDFAQTPTVIELDIQGTKYSYPLNQGQIEGNSSDTFLVTSNATIPFGAYTIKAYFTQAIDNVSTNDTAKHIIDFNPQLKVELLYATDPIHGKDCFFVNSVATQKVKIENTGTSELSNIVLVLSVEDPSTSPSSYFIIRDTLTTSILAGATETYSFKETYIVPSIDMYNIEIMAYLECDSALLRSFHGISECADIENIGIIALNNPPLGVKDVQGDSINIEVQVKNYSDINDLQEIKITAVVSSPSHGMIKTMTGNFDLRLLEDKSYRFDEGYIVPNENYSIVVYLDKNDNYQDNDTLKISREVGDVSMGNILSSGIRLEQNIPNPANNSTTIKYNIPKDGEVLFTVYSISGQVLYTTSEKVQSGDHQIEINTSAFAVGVYFYSMEFNGQRLTKRMSKQ